MKKTPLDLYTDEEILREAGIRLAAKRTKPPRAKVLKLCPKGCGQEFGAREMRIHKPTCNGKK